MNDLESTPGRLVLVRHGQTEWSRTGRHTGLTDVPLTERGEADARALGHLLAPWRFGLVLCSPLTRARRTAELAGLRAEPDPDLLEWDYGGYEGLTTPEIREQRGGDAWTVVADGVVPGRPPARRCPRWRRALRGCSPARRPPTATSRSSAMVTACAC